MKKVVVTNYGIIHFLANCRDCDWEFSDYLEREKGIRLVRKHVKKFGHSVTIEKGIATLYSLGKDNK